MKKYISTNLIWVIKHLYDKATSAVLFNGSTGVRWCFEPSQPQRLHQGCSTGGRLLTIVGVWKECLLSPTLFNIFLERIMTDALGDHKSTVSIGSRTITSLCFAHDINGLWGKVLAKLVEHLNKASTAYSMQISAEKTKLMTNNTSSINKV